MSLKKTGNPDLLKELFYQRTKEWPFHMMHVEGGTIGTFYDVELKSSQSFDLIPAAIELCFEQRNQDLFTTALYLLAQCVRMSDTTEMPGIMAERWRELEAKVRDSKDSDCITAWEGIKNWYRL